MAWSSARHRWAEHSRLLGYHEKKQFRASEQDRPDVLERRREFIEWMKTADFSRLVFIDETGCNLQLTPRYGWSVRGQRIIDTRPAVRGKNLTVVGAIRQDRVPCHDKLEGAPNSTSRLAFVDKVLCPVLYPGDIVVLDNLSVHKHPDAIALIKAQGASVKILPPYSPELNPIEMCWSFVKHVLRRLRERTLDGLRRGVWHALMRVTGRHLAAWFKACGFHQCT